LQTTGGDRKLRCSSDTLARVERHSINSTTTIKPFVDYIGCVFKCTTAHIQHLEDCSDGCKAPEDPIFARVAANCSEVITTTQHNKAQNCLASVFGVKMNVTTNTPKSEIKTNVTTSAQIAATYDYNSTNSQTSERTTFVSKAAEVGSNKSSDIPKLSFIFWIACKIFIELFV